MSDFKLTPSVDASREFYEIATDFSRPLDLVREAISNAFDANAKEIDIQFLAENNAGEFELKILLRDDGDGMDREGLQSFFDLGNSMRRKEKQKLGIIAGNDVPIGEKGHGTKIYFNSSRVKVTTVKDSKKLTAVMDEPRRALFDGRIPVVNVTEEDCSEKSGTQIEIWGYNKNRTDHFTHAEVKDYILWFTKFGSIEREFGIDTHKDMILRLKGTDVSEIEEIKFGHVFAKESESLDKLIGGQVPEEAPSLYCRRFIKSGYLKHNTFIKYEMVFYVEGTRAKYSYNGMIRRKGKPVKPGAYTIQQRYGLYLCKDYIPVTRKNEWITTKGSEFTLFHAFVNCQNLHLTANRGTVDNTPAEIMNDLEAAVREFYEEITSSDEWNELNLLDTIIKGDKTTKQEAASYTSRINTVNRSGICRYEHNGREMLLSEPINENGVYALFMQLNFLHDDLFNFDILDYNTHEGIDVLVKNKGSVCINQSHPYYVEFKYNLNKSFNHGFKHLHSIICWNLGSGIGNGSQIVDVTNERRTVEIIPGRTGEERTRYYLTDPRNPFRIEIYVLSQYIKETLGIEFRKRTQDELVNG